MALPDATEVICTLPAKLHSSGYWKTRWDTVGKKRTQAMHLPGQKQCRTTGAATVQEKETLVVQAKKTFQLPQPDRGKNRGKTAKKPTSRL